MALVTKTIKRFVLFGLLPLLLVGGIVAWFERDELLRCYYLHRLEKARGEDAAEWAEKLAGLDEPPVASVVKLLAEDDEDVCENARLVLSALGRRWLAGDPRLGELMCQAIKEFSRLSVPGRRAVVTLAADWLAAPEERPACLVCASGQLVAQVCHAPAPCLHGPAVELALSAVARSSEPDVLCAARDLTRQALASADATTRVRALKLAAQPGVGLGKESVPLLQDKDPLVRRAAMLAVGTDPEALDTDALLAWLHDADAEVRQLCERALRSEPRNLPPEHIRLGRLLTDPSWEVRLKVLDFLEEEEELDDAAWLRRLSHDPSRAVRTTVVRVVGENDALDLTDRLEEMSHSDPDPTVAGLARHYLNRRRASRLPRFD